MQFPINPIIGGVTIPSHFIFDWLSLAIAYRYYLYIKSKTTDLLSNTHRWYIIIGAVGGGFIGSRLLAILEDPNQVFHHNLLYYFANKTIIGFLIGAIIGVELVKKYLGENQSSGDLFTFPLIIGIIIGRIGCFLTGVSDETVGLPSGLPWAINQGDGIPRHPTSLYEILFLTVLFFILRYIQKRITLKNGDLFRLFIIAYFTLRFCIEFIKPVHPLILGLTAIQLVCGSMVLYYISKFIINNNSLIYGSPNT